MRTASHAAILAACLNCTIAGAATSVAATSERVRQPLSLDEAVARATEGSTLVRMARTERDVVASRRVGAGVLFPANPLATFAAGSRRDRSTSTPPASGFEWGARLEQMIEIGGQRGTRLTEAARQLDVARARVHLAEIETRARVRAAYVGLQLAEAQARSAEERESLAARVLDSARARVRAGAASDVELHLAEAEAARFTYERLGAELFVDEAAGSVRALVGLPAATTIELTTPLSPPAATSGDLEGALAAAQSRRAELLVLDAGRSAIDASIARLRRELVPSPALFVEVAGQQPGQLYVGGGVTVSLPIARRNQGALAHARAEREQLHEERDVTARAIELEVAHLYHAVETHRRQTALWTDRIVPAATANVELVRQGWAAGKFDIFRVVQVAREAAEARKRELETLGALWDATIALERATGAK
jgi:outer membrane protein, heavy metal efflux system